jgi:hypothetical protein
MDFIFVLIGCGIHAVFLFKREWLFSKKDLSALISIALVLFALSFVLGGAATSFFKVPLISLVIFLGMRSLFFRLYGRNPRDSFWTMDAKLMKDGIFNFLFWILGLFIPVLIAFEVL